MSTVKSKKLQVGTDASASNNFTIYQPAVPDGTLRIGVGNADSPTEVGQFNTNGYQPQKPVIFRANRSAAQTISTATYTKVQFNNVDFDTDSCYDNTTNYRFTPTVAGYYLINSTVSINSATYMVFTNLYKNGSGYQLSARNQLGTITGDRAVVNTAVVYMNGSTDYLEVYVYQDSGGNKDTIGSAQQCNLTGMLIAQA